MEAGTDLLPQIDPYLSKRVSNDEKDERGQKSEVDVLKGDVEVLKEVAGYLYKKVAVLEKALEKEKLNSLFLRKNFETLNDFVLKKMCPFDDMVGHKLKLTAPSFEKFVFPHRKAPTTNDSEESKPKPRSASLSRPRKSSEKDAK